MSGKFIYAAIAALFGVLCALVKLFPFLLLSIIYLVILMKSKRFKRDQAFIMIIIGVSCFIKGEWTEVHNQTKILESKTFFTIKYTQNPIIDGDLLKVQGIETQLKEKVLLRYQIKSEEEKNTLQNKSFYGILCNGSGTLNHPSTAKNPNGFDYRSFLAAKEIFWVIDLNQSPLQSCHPIRNSPAELIKNFRFAGIKYLEKNFPSEIAGLSSALIFGETDILDSELLSNYQRTGIVHLLAISGLHVSLFIGMIFLIGIRGGLTRQVMTNALLVLLPIYVVLTGSSPSVVRSGLMISIILLAEKWKHHLKIMTIDAISLSFVFFIFFSPLIIYDIGFQLSFLVSFSIILSAPRILKGYQGNGGKMLATSVIAQASAMPILLYHYFEISLIGIFANLLYIPLFSFIYLPAVYVLLIIHLLFGTAPTWMIGLLQKTVELSNKLIEVLAGISYMNFTPGRPHIILMVIYIILLGRIFYIWERAPYPNRKTHLLVLGVILLAVQPCWNMLNPYGEVTMIDVGQGDSILIHLPHGQGNYLIDTGGSMNFLEEKWKQRTKPFEVGRDVVLPFLKAKGITKIDKLILTHGDMDHIGGAESILSGLRVEQILMPSVKETSETEQQITELAVKQRIPVIKVSSGNYWSQSESEFFVLSPEKNFTGERNRGSIAIFAEIGGVRWFFGGDLDQEGEENILRKYPNLAIDVLKAGHHGSKTSSGTAFINQIRPKAALISAGEHNRFGHPHQEVLDRLNAVNAVIYRTDLQGAITYYFYRGKGTFLTYLP
ncbi:DNA internalization-related competence protein ComEC/Rec2 [Bacillus sp. USDA818B3_A]|uniref:DNA internalization-related competence protein ComEC/Rec2 n=1 Tax=Bacillus sp. USDA818B3_A TaxID=2698834 RepID=UPI00136E5BBE|nr:DNA internalization-related competence protein ComEC/Rec2 [Bacillus sp. USDA818B3_A]